MGGAYKNPDKEEIHSIIPSKRLLEGSFHNLSDSRKLLQSTIDPSCPSFESNVDERPTKFQRTECRDFDQKPSLNQLKVSYAKYDKRPLSKGEIGALNADISCGSPTTNGFISNYRVNEKDIFFDKATNTEFKFSRSPKDHSSSWQHARKAAFCGDIFNKVNFEFFKEEAVTDDVVFDAVSEEKSKDDVEMKDLRYKVHDQIKSLSNSGKKNKEKEKVSCRKNLPFMAAMKVLPYDKVGEQNTLVLEQMKPKDDPQFYAKKLESCNSYYSDDGFDKNGAIEIVDNSPSSLNSEHLYRSKTGYHEGIQGKAQVATILYKPGECMSELIKLWKQFDIYFKNKNGDIASYGLLMDIIIPPQYISSTHHQLRYAHMWGTDVYTIDSDVVAVLIHTGYCRPLSSPIPDSIEELRATIRVLPPQECYLSTIRNNIHSRAWGCSAQCSYRVESCSIVKKCGETIKLEPRYTYLSGFAPTISPIFSESKMITRAAAASNTTWQQRFVREVSVQYNLCNEPWMKYSVSIVADKGMRKPLYTSARLKNGEVLYLETHLNRYELCYNAEKEVFPNYPSASDQTPVSLPPRRQCSNPDSMQAGDRSTSPRDGNCADRFRWSRCKKPLPIKTMLSIGIPSPAEHLMILEEGLDWEEIQWSEEGVWIAGKEYKLARAHFISPQSY